MVSSINGYSNVSFGNVGATANAGQHITAPYQYAQAPQADTAEFATKKKSNAGKITLGVIGTVAVAAAALYGLVKTGKITKIENPTKWTEKLQNLAYKGGAGVGKGVEYAAQKGKSLIDTIKGWFSKKGAEKTAETVAEVATEAVKA